MDDGKINLYEFFSVLEGMASISERSKFKIIPMILKTNRKRNTQEGIANQSAYAPFQKQLIHIENWSFLLFYFWFLLFALF